MDIVSKENKMQITEKQLKQIIKEEISNVLVPGYGYMTVDRIKKKLGRLLADAAAQAAQDPPGYTHLNNGVIFALHSALKDNKSANDPFLSEKTDYPLKNLQVTALSNGFYRFFDLKSKLQGLYTKEGEHKSGDIRISKADALKLINRKK
jgi:hypothetical protein